MTRLLSLLLGAAAVGAWYLVELDRRSGRALDLVELDGGLPAPLWTLRAGASVLLGLLSRSGRTQATGITSPRTAKAPPPSAPSAPDRDSSSWYARAVQTSAARGWEHGVHVSWGPLPGVDVMLVLQSATPGRIKRSVRAFAAMMSELPRPRRARVQLRQCDTSGLDVRREVESAFHTFLPRSHLKVLREGDDVDVLYSQPEPGWPGQQG